MYSVKLKDGRPIGHIQAVPISLGWEIGYHIGSDYTGMSYATEAINAFVPEIIRTLGFDRFTAYAAQKTLRLYTCLNGRLFNGIYGMGRYQGMDKYIVRFVRTDSL